MPAKIKILTFVYILLIAGIIIVANFKSTHYLLKFGGGIPYFDKIAHFFLMGGFSFLVNLVLQARTFSVRKARFLLGTVIVLTVVTIEEISQIFVAGRSFDYGDLVADYLGILLFGELARLLVRQRSES
jgi:polysaccharide biosynthesis protein VpsQ